jgi:hypothetical protein
MKAAREQAVIQAPRRPRYEAAVQVHRWLGWEWPEPV